MLAVEKGGGGKTIRHKETFLPARTGSYHNATRKPHHHHHHHLARSNVCLSERERGCVCVGGGGLIGEKCRESVVYVRLYVYIGER